MKYYVEAAMEYCNNRGLEMPMVCNIQIACNGVVSIYFNETDEMHFVDIATLMRLN